MFSIITAYRRWTKATPLAASMVSTGFLLGAGDFLAQEIELRQRVDPSHVAPSSMFKEVLSEHEPKPAPLQNTYNVARTTRAVVYGSVVFAPLGGTWYKILARLSLGKVSWANTLARVALDQVAFAPFIGIPLYFGSMALMESPTNVVEAVSTKLRRTWADTVKANWVVWPAVQLLNFTFVPLESRLLVVNVVSIGWNCFLSMVNNGDGAE